MAPFCQCPSKCFIKLAKFQLFYININFSCRDVNFIVLKSIES